MALLAAIALAQIGLLRVAGAVTLSQPVTSQLITLKINYFALGTFVLSVPILLFLLTPRDTALTAVYAIAIGGAILGAMFVRETLMLFVSRKIPILHWFLYLCTVEIFPVSLVWLHLTKL